MFAMNFLKHTTIKEDDDAVYLQLSCMTPNQRLDEFAILQERVWGDQWTKRPIKKMASIEKIKR